MKQQENNTALYLRLSRDDENYGDSVSIETQRTILRQFVQDNGFHVVEEYVDDGWSGTNFDRPAFKRMIEDVESGKINCIITKDLSRFGREHVMMGYYLEFYFVEKNVRYIAVSDGEDTEKGLSDFVPFKNLFNEWYAKDTSRKIKASMNAKFKAGERTCAYAPIGYKKHPEIKNKLAIDEETRWIVEKIYEYALETQWMDTSKLDIVCDYYDGDIYTFIFCVPDIGRYIQFVRSVKFRMLPKEKFEVICFDYQKDFVRATIEGYAEIYEAPFSEFFETWNQIRNKEQNAG